MSDDEGTVVFSREVNPGTELNITIEPSVKFVADYEEYGTLEINLPHGATITVTAGTKAPKLYTRVPDTIAFEEENVVRLDDQE